MLHTSHLKGFFPVCLTMWTCRALFWLKALSHWAHLKGRSPATKHTHTYFHALGRRVQIHLVPSKIIGTKYSAICYVAERCTSNLKQIHSSTQPRLHKLSINFHSHMHEKEISVSHKRASWRRHVEKKLRRDEGHCTNIILHSLCVLAYLETSVSAWRKTRGEIPLTYEWMTQRGAWHTAESFSMFYITAPDSRLASGIQSPSLTQLKSLINFMKSKKQKQSLGIDAGWKVFVLQCCFETKERKPIGI